MRELAGEGGTAEAETGPAEVPPAAECPGEPEGDDPVRGDPPNTLALRGDKRKVREPQLRISLEIFAVEGDGRLSGSESISDEAGENMDHGVHGRPVA